MNFKAKFKILLSLISSLILYSCGTTQPSIPPVPLKKGDYEFRYGVGISLNDYSVLSLQASIFWGMSDRDALGFTFNNFFIPGHISYTRYWPTKNSNYGGNFQFHLGDLLGMEFNPRFEADVAVSNYSGETSQSFKIGISYFYHPLMRENINCISPIIGYLLQWKSMELEAALYYGLTEHYVEYYNLKQRLSDKPPYNEFRIPHDSIITFIDTINYKHYLGKVLLIKLKDSTDILILERDTYADCLGCSKVRRQKSKYMADSTNQILWLQKTYFGSRSNGNYLELNVNKILNDYNSGKDIITKEDDDLIEKKKSKVKTPWEDINFGIGYRHRKETK